MRVRTGRFSEPSVRHANAACDRLGDVPKPRATLAASAPPFCAGRSPSRSRLDLMLVLLKLPFWYTNLLEILISHKGLVQCERHPKNSMPESMIHSAAG
jgi:hypothetical protein